MAKRFRAVEDLVRQVETKAENEPDMLAILIALIKIVDRADVDPYLLNGALIEAIANTIHTRIPTRRRQQVAAATIRLLLERLQAGGAI